MIGMWVGGGVVRVGGGCGGELPQRQIVQRTGPWSAFRGVGKGELLFCTVKDVPLFIAGAAKLEAVVISNSCMVYMVFVLKQPLLYSNHARHAGSLL